MSLRDQILARIDETPHRSPTLMCIIQRLYSVANEPDVRECVRIMLIAGTIGTENGDSGVTYRRAKAKAGAA